jgi:TP901 family phage tail tape measure protein
MTDRTVKVSLLLQATGYMQGMEQVHRKTRETGSEIEKLAQRREAFNTLGTAAVGFGAAVGIGVGMAVSKFAEFDQQMSYVQAATHETAANMALLRDAAMEAGASTVYSATEAAQAIEELSKAGVSTRDILGGALDGALDAASAGGMEVAATAELMASTLSQFNLEGGQASHVADLLAAGAGKAQGDMSDLGAALSQAGLVANQFGLSVDDTVGTLAAFANAGMMGSDAGTSLRTMLLRLANPTKEVTALMAETGIQAYNAAGEFVGLENLAGQLQASLGGMTQAQRDQTLAMIFGQDAIRGANILMKEGAAGIRDWTAAVNDQGYAADTAATRLDNLKGDWEALTGAVDTALISMGEGANGPLRGFVQSLTALTDGFNELPDGAQQAVLAAAVIAAAVGLAGGAALLAVPQIAEFKAALVTLGLTGAGTRAGLAGMARHLPAVAAAFTAAALAMSVYNTVSENGIPTQEELVNALQGTADAAGQLRAAVGQNKIAPFITEDALTGLKDLPGLMDRGAEASNNWFTAMLTQTTQQNRSYDAIKRLGSAYADLANGGDLEQAQDAFRQLATSQELNRAQQKQLLEEMSPYRDAILGVANANGMAVDDATLLNIALGYLTPGMSDAASASEDAANAVDGVSESAEAAQEQIDALKDAIREFTTEAYGVQEAQDNLNQVLNDSVGALDEFVGAGGSAQEAMSGTSNAAIGLRDVMAEIDQTARDSAVSIIENGGSVEDAMSAYGRGRERVVEMLTAMGVAPQQARAWADEMYGPTSDVEGQLRNVATAAHSIPESRGVDVSVTGAESAAQKLANLKRWADSIPSVKRITLETIELRSISGQGRVVSSDHAAGAYYQLGKPKDFAAGGWASGIYPATVGGIHRFAEAGHDEAYITMDPQYQDRSRRIWEEVGYRLGAWQPATASAVAAPVAAAPAQAGPLVGKVTFQASGNIRNDLNELDHQLRHYARGGRGGRSGG